MTSTRYSQASRQLITQAREELSSGDVIQASEKGWGAAAQMVKAVADARRWRHNGHRFLFETVKRVVDETENRRIYELFLAANSLHANFYENWMPAEMVATGLDQVEEFIGRLETLLT